MSKINFSDYSSSRPKLMPEDLEGDSAILTIASVESVTVGEDPTDQQERLLLLLEEHEDMPLWLNMTMIRTLIDRLGSETNDWIGEKVPVESHVATYRGQEFPKVRVVPAERWDELLRPRSRSRARSRKTTKARNR